MVRQSLDNVVDTLFSAETIQQRVKELAGEILNDYWGKEVILLCVQKGAANFAMDLRKELHKQSYAKHGDILDVIPDDVSISLYADPTAPEKKPKTILGPDPNIDYRGKEVLIVEDIVDRGLTMKYLLESLRKKNPSSIRLCALLTKPEAREVEIKIDYLGFEVGNQFVVGYGLDYEQKYRDLPFIGILKEK
ncbi:hypoxanthine phosphoribosyltransferase [Candidatus Woesearchaeota archaeon]|nr:hypoxanthine phosphoribosyltransferase [Candidatus Woesearchaeota archaeon]